MRGRAWIAAATALALLSAGCGPAQNAANQAGNAVGNATNATGNAVGNMTNATGNMTTNS